MVRKYAALGLAALLGTAAAAPVDLNKDNFNAEVLDSGKHAFVKFFAPWSLTLPVCMRCLPSPRAERE